MAAISKKEIEKFKARLLEIKRQLMRSLEGTSSEVKSPEESKGYSQHQADEGTADFDRTIALQLTGKEMVILKQVDRALEKIDEDTYGICDFTNKPIPLPRLEAIPYAVMTVDAQEKFERGEIELL